MKKKLTCLQLLVMLLAFGFSASAQRNYWSDISKSNLPVAQDAGKIMPTIYRALTLDTSGLLDFFNSAPVEFTDDAKRNPAILMLPMPDGSFQKFTVVKTAIMEPGLAAQFPGFKTLGGQGLDDRYATLKIDWSATGFHAMIFSPVTGAVVIDPYTNASLVHYLSYYKKDFKHVDRFLEEGEIINTSGGVAGPAIVAGTQAGQCIGGTLRKYRLAVACTGEYAKAVGGANVTKAQALSHIITSVNRVDGVYETELDIRLVLIDSNLKIVFIDSASDPFTGNKNANRLIGESQKVIDSIIKSSNYDIGHTFSTGAGGLAEEGVVCETNHKAKGVTGLSNPMGDPYDIDFVAHEMGHEFGASHTFNSTTGNCNGTGDASTNAEPGSGSTIMAYAGICNANDLQPHSDPYFHAISLNEITGYSINGAGNACAVPVPTGNTPPVVNAGSDYVIPKSTPFVLTGSASDADNDPMTYSWEQVDVGGPFGNWNNPSGDAPLFRSFPPVTNPVRYFPKISDIRNNTTTIGEILPSYGRVMHFRLTARDNRAGGGGVCFDQAAVTVAASAGPFVVTEPNSSTVVWHVGSFVNVNWNVASTDISPVSCANVAIELSTDGGLTFPYTILTTTPNDGHEEVIVPNNITTTARIRVRSVNSIFFDISNDNFTIEAANETAFAFNNPTAVVVCNNDPAGTLIRTSAINGYSNLITLSASGNPAGSTVIFGGNPITPGSSDSIRLQGNYAPGDYFVTITGTSGNNVKSRVIEFIIGSPSSAPAISSPANNANQVPLNPVLKWSAVPGILTYNFQISTTPNFTTTVQDIDNVAGTSYTLTTLLAANTSYYWRIRGRNACGYSPFSNGSLFTTAPSVCGDTLYSTNVPLVIDTTISTIESKLTIPSGGVISDVNVVGLKGTHSYIQDLTISLISPANTEVVLFSSVCGNENNFDINFDDEASSGSIPCPPTGGVTRRPSDNLSAFDNENSTGTWILRVKDDARQDGGFLNRWGLLITCKNSALPVNWLSFTAKKNENNTATLQWSVNSEVNNDHYEVEHSADGQNFSSFAGVSTGAAAGSVKQYAFNDIHPFEGRNYYRIRQVDRDGHFTYSDIKTLMFDKLQAQYIVYPNPAANFTTLRLLSNQKQLTLRLFDAAGKIVYNNSFESAAAGAEVTIPVKRLSKGIYILNITTQKGVSSEKIIVK